LFVLAFILTGDKIFSLLSGNFSFSYVVFLVSRVENNPAIPDVK
jgi:hypothetical protein